MIWFAGKDANCETRLPHPPQAPATQTARFDLAQFDPAQFGTESFAP
jgi:hypothetical protein